MTSYYSIAVPRRTSPHTNSQRALFSLRHSFIDEEDEKIPNPRQGWGFSLCRYHCRLLLVMRLGQKLLDDMLALVVGPLAPVGVANMALGVDEIEGGPVDVLVGVPGRVLVVLHHRVFDALFGDGAGHVVGHLLIA